MQAALKRAIATARPSAPVGPANSPPVRAKPKTKTNQMHRASPHNSAGRDNTTRRRPLPPVEQRRSSTSIAPIAKREKATPAPPGKATGESLTRIRLADDKQPARTIGTKGALPVYSSGVSANPDK